MWGWSAVLLLMNWEDGNAIEVTEVQPYFIEASLTKENPHTAKAKRERQLAEERARRIRAQREANRQAEINRQRLEEKRLKELAEQQAAEQQALKEAEQAAQQEALEIEEEEAVDEAEREFARQQAEMELALAIADEEAYRRAVTDDEKAMAYVAQIQREIIQNWSRPPSARNGMQALLRVFLVPTGEVVNVTVEQSSGNDAFDRSAILAVQKAGQFVVPSDPRQFERNFREFEVFVQT